VANQKQLNDMMRQVQKMQEDMAVAQASLEDETIEGSSGGGAVRVSVTGAGDVRSVSIDPEAVDPDDLGMLEDLLTAAVNDSLRQARELQAQRLGAVTGGLDLGSLGGLVG
jgi:nucleoid-associated protein EbfC